MRRKRDIRELTYDVMSAIYTQKWFKSNKLKKFVIFTSRFSSLYNLSHDRIIDKNRLKTFKSLIKLSKTKRESRNLGWMMDSDVGTKEPLALISERAFFRFYQILPNFALSDWLLSYFGQWMLYVISNRFMIKSLKRQPINYACFFYK